MSEHDKQQPVPDWMWLCMPIKVVDRKCKECPELTVTNNPEVLWADGKKLTAENNLECGHLQACMYARKIQKEDK